MAVFRKRLIFWLIKAYLKRWGKVIAISFFLGLGFFFLLMYTSKFFVRLFPVEKKIRVGVIGANRADNIPYFVTSDLSRGLTRVADDGSILPDVAKNWEIKDGGKTYVFHLTTNLAFSDGSKVSAKDINYRFTGVRSETPDPQTIIFHLKETYSPFLVTTSRPIFKKGYIGVGEYKLAGIHLNGNFVESLSISSNKDRFYQETFQFYPSEEALKQAFTLGEITEARGLTSEEFRGTTFSTFPNVSVHRQIDYTRLVTLFFDTQDPYLSDKKIRNALTYALPDQFTEGERSFLAYPPQSIYRNHNLEHKQDLDHTKLLLDAAKKEASASATFTITIKAATRYHEVAQKIADIWKKYGITSKVEDEESIPAKFQVYLGDFTLPRDPDQYVLWHSTSQNNITRLNSQRLDKLLEDGRNKTDVSERTKIYYDFQKYLLDESPAAFLYFPYDYVITRK